jgi:hypothetical protein
MTPESTPISPNDKGGGVWTQTKIPVYDLLKGQIFPAICNHLSEGEDIIIKESRAEDHIFGVPPVPVDVIWEGIGCHAFTRVILGLD